MHNDGTLSSQLNKVTVIIAFFQFVDHYPQYDIARHKAKKSDIIRDFLELSFKNKSKNKQLKINFLLWANSYSSLL
ncbi:hypothetical protein ES703_64334 [subsurface metagenome]